MRLLHERRRGRGWETLLAVVAAVAAGAAAGYLLGSRASSDTVAPPGAARTDKVTALGRLQPTNGVVPVHGPPGDRIARMKAVAPGKELKAGAEIAELASRPDRLLEVKVAESQQEEAETSQKFAEVAGHQNVVAAVAALDQTKASRVSDLVAINAKLKFVQLQADFAGKQLDRLKTLRGTGVKVADEDMDRAELLKAQADSEVASTLAAVEKTKTSYDESEKAGAARVAAAKAELQEGVARVPVESSRERLKLAQQLSEQTLLKAPISGTVLKVNGREGQPTGVEPVLLMADLSTMTAVTEVYESDVARVATWVKTAPVKAEVKNPALPKPLSGVIRVEQDISRIIARNQVFALGPREDADRRVIEVIVHLDPSAAAEAGRFVGLQVTVTLEPGK